jgi:hypothetical protein
MWIGHSARIPRRSPLAYRPVTLGDLAKDGTLLEVECSACRPSRHLYIEPLSLGLPKRLPVPDVADHLVCSVCGARSVALGMTTQKADTRAAGCESSTGERQISAMTAIDRPARLPNPPPVKVATDTPVPETPVPVCPGGVRGAPIRLTQHTRARYPPRVGSLRDRQDISKQNA